MPVSHVPVDIDMFCPADPKEAITFLEKTKEKVSPQTPQKLIFKGQILSRCRN